ncbi:MAG: DUF2207 domain-containing protein [Anaerolineae bacterium]
MRSKTFVTIMVLLACLWWASPALATKRYHAERFDVVLEVRSDGSLLVTETVRFRFEGGPFTYAFRDLTYTGIDEIDRLQASMDDAILPQGTGPGQVEVVPGHPLQVTWHFSPTFDSVHEFALIYRVQGAIRQENEADVLIWRAIPEDHDYAIEHSTIILRYPSSIPLQDGPELSKAAVSTERSDGQVQWTTTGLKADESLVVTARFAPGSLIEAPPQWQARQIARQRQIYKAVPVGLAAGLSTFGLGLVALSRFLIRQRRTGTTTPAYAMHVSTPPDQSPPGLAVRLARGGMPALATFFDLAGQAVLHIEEREKGWLGRKRYSLYLSPSNKELRPHERGLLRALFEQKGGEMHDSLPLSEAAARLSRRAQWYREPLEQEMEVAGWLDPRRKATRNRLMTWAFVALLAGSIVMTASLIVGGGAVEREARTVLTLAAIAAGVGGALALLGLVTLIAGAVFSPLSEQGEQAAAAWKSFATFLKGVIRGGEFVAGEELFERYLPFAAGFGLGVAWAKYFHKRGYTAIPAWFRALEAEVNDFGAVVTVMAATSGSFSGSAGATGAAGASGGGSSGAG